MAKQKAVSPIKDRPSRETQRGALLLFARLINALAMEIPEDRPFKFAVKAGRDRARRAGCR